MQSSTLKGEKSRFGFVLFCFVFSARKEECLMVILIKHRKLALWRGSGFKQVPLLIGQKSLQSVPEVGAMGVVP